MECVSVYHSDSMLKNKIMKKLLLTLCMPVLLAVPAISQSASVSGVKKVSVKNLSPIMENNEVKGYFFFYFIIMIMIMISPTSCQSPSSSSESANQIDGDH